ncbi:MAG TPA: hypothetical protein VH374_04515 [Polyangia bacterium]|jgi:hypothetical protein|nr:hypothetical protein [Polyangia bacterium]
MLILVTGGLGANFDWAEALVPMPFEATDLREISDCRPWPA